jgi:hypothetical protein
LPNFGHESYWKYEQTLAQVKSKRSIANNKKVQVIVLKANTNSVQPAHASEPCVPAHIRFETQFRFD